MERPLVFMFSGQGSHYYQMGRDLYEAHPVFRRTMDEGDAIARDASGRSLTAEVFGHPISAQFTDFEITHPALLVIQYALYQTLLSEGLRPDYVWGNSAGEIVAAVVAGVIGFDDALRMVIDCAALVAATCPPGGMLAVLASPDLYGRAAELNESTTLAGVNYPGHFVLSGEQSGLSSSEDFLKKEGVLFQRLDILFGFHSAAIDPSRTALIDRMAVHGPLAKPKIPILSSAAIGPMATLPTDWFWEAIRRPISFWQTLEQFEHRDRALFVDCGPSGTLATFLKYGLGQGSEAIYLPVLTPLGQSLRNLTRLRHSASLSV